MHYEIAQFLIGWERSQATGQTPRKAGGHRNGWLGGAFLHHIFRQLIAERTLQRPHIG